MCRREILLDHGFGAVGVAIDSAPTEGVKVVPLSEIKSGFPILKNSANRHRAVGFTPKQWHYVFANTFSEEKSLELYERYHIPALGRVFWGSALANIHPGRTTPTSTTTTTRDRRCCSSLGSRIISSPRRWGTRMRSTTSPRR
jgi:hypothetical protein